MALIREEYECMQYLISTSYKTTGKSVIWKFDPGNLKLEVFREDQYYSPEQVATHNASYTPKVALTPTVRFKDFIYFGMRIYQGNLYCGGGNVLSILDLEGRVLKRQEIDFLSDAHDLDIIEGQVYCVNTGHDRIEIFSPNFEHQQTVHLKKLACFRDRRLLPQKEGYGTDSLHANFLSSHKNDVWVTHFFSCESRRMRAIILSIRYLAGIIGMGGRPFRHKGFVLNLFSGKILNSGGVVTLDGKRLIGPLYGPHDGIVFNNEFYIHSTHNIETLVYDEHLRVAARIPYHVGIFLRGLHPIDRRTFLIGASRINPRRTAAFMYKLVLRGRKHSRFEEASSIKIVDRKTQTIVRSVYFETFQGIHPEIYKIIPLEV